MELLGACIDWFAIGLFIGWLIMLIVIEVTTP